jgi:hypothetical protein
MAAGAAAAAVLLILLLPPIFSDAPTPGIARAEGATAVRSLRQQMDPVLVFEGGDGVTIIWIFEQPEPDLSSGDSMMGGWA